jgi:hypothetical protein
MLSLTENKNGEVMGLAGDSPRGGCTFVAHPAISLRADSITRLIQIILVILEVKYANQPLDSSSIDVIAIQREVAVRVTVMINDNGSVRTVLIPRTV